MDYFPFFCFSFQVFGKVKGPSCPPMYLHARGCIVFSTGDRHFCFLATERRWPPGLPTGPRPLQQPAGVLAAFLMSGGSRRSSRCRCAGALPACQAGAAACLLARGGSGQPGYLPEAAVGSQPGRASTSGRPARRWWRWPWLSCECSGRL